MCVQKGQDSQAKLVCPVPESDQICCLSVLEEACDMSCLKPPLCFMEITQPSSFCVCDG